MSQLRSFLSGKIVKQTRRVRKRVWQMKRGGKPKVNWRWVAGLGLAIVFVVVAARAEGQEILDLDSASDAIPTQDNTTIDFVAPQVFQAAGPDIASIQGTVDAYRKALGDPVNNNNPGPLTLGRREINRDGGVPPSQATTPPVTPFTT